MCSSANARLAARAGPRSEHGTVAAACHAEAIRGRLPYEPHESPAVMTVPLMVLAALRRAAGLHWHAGLAVVPGLPERAASATATLASSCEPELLRLMALSSRRRLRRPRPGLVALWPEAASRSAEEPDVLERLRPDIFALLRRKYFVDEIYEATVIRFNAWWARACDWLDYWVWNGAVQLVSLRWWSASPGSTASSTNTW